MTDLENQHVTDPVSTERQDDTTFISSLSDIRTLENSPDCKSSTLLAPSFSIPTRNTVVDQLSGNEYSMLNSDKKDPLKSSGDENPFQNDRLPIWQRQQQFQDKCYENTKVDSDTGSPSTATSSAMSLSLPLQHGNHDMRKQTYSPVSNSPDNSQFDGYNYKLLNETPTSPELIAYRQQQMQYSTNCLLPHPLSNTTTTNSYNHDPTTNISNKPHPGSPPGTPEVMSVLHKQYKEIHNLIVILLFFFYEIGYFLVHKNYML